MFVTATASPVAGRVPPNEMPLNQGNAPLEAPVQKISTETVNGIEGVDDRGSQNDLEELTNASTCPASEQPTRPTTPSTSYYNRPILLEHIFPLAYLQETLAINDEYWGWLNNLSSESAANIWAEDSSHLPYYHEILAVIRAAVRRATGMEEPGVPIENPSEAVIAWLAENMRGTVWEETLWSDDDTQCDSDNDIPPRRYIDYEDSDDYCEGVLLDGPLL